MPAIVPKFLIVPLTLLIINALTAPISGYPPITEPEEVMLNDVDDVVQGPSEAVTVPLAQLALASKLIKHAVKINTNVIK